MNIIENIEQYKCSLKLLMNMHFTAVIFSMFDAILMMFFCVCKYDLLQPYLQCIHKAFLNDFSIEESTYSLRVSHVLFLNDEISLEKRYNFVWLSINYLEYSHSSFLFLGEKIDFCFKFRALFVVQASALSVWLCSVCLQHSHSAAKQT
jgi:hypothetical protein